jgi:predicted small lipoprotein YifL
VLQRINMLTYKKLFFALFTFLIVLSLTGCRKKGTSIEAPKEDVAAKKMLQGIWISEDESPFFRVKGDTIYYPDTTSSPVYFYIHGDSLVMRGATLEKYLIVKQSPHLFVFKNHNGEQVRLELSTNADDINSFVMNRPVALNQNQLIKRDSVIMRGDTKYHYYIQVNPTTYKVVHSSLNDDGLQVDNVYYDNIVHISVFQGAHQLFSRDFHRMDFKNKVPENILGQSILSDINYAMTDEKGVHFTASICIPDSPSAYLVDVCVSFNGGFTLSVR